MADRMMPPNKPMISRAFWADAMGILNSVWTTRREEMTTILTIRLGSDKKLEPNRDLEVDLAQSPIFIFRRSKRNYDVPADDVVGRIMKVHAARVGTP